jgi:hypothetical protein
MAGTWKDLVKQPGASVDTMLLLTDGTVLAHESNSSNWHQLTPNPSGSYTNGTWTAIAPMPPNSTIPAAQNGPNYGPLFFGSAVLGDGTLLVAGGEYNFGLNCDMAAATRFDPVTSAWTNVATPSGWTNVGDVPLCVLADGRALLGNLNSTQTAFFDPVTGSFSPGPNKGDRCAEESFTLLPDGTVLAVDCTAIPKAEKYVPSTNTWVSAGSTPSTLPQGCPGIVAEIGPTVLLPNGHAFVIGATGDTALYIPPANPTDPGTWAAGPAILDASSTRYYPIDAPAVLLPNGRVLLAASPAPPCSFPGPTSFFEYNPAANTLSQVSAPSNAGSACFTGRFLLLPNGQVLFSNQSSSVTIYTPGGAPDPAWKPVITAVPSHMAVGHHYLLSGRQFNGLSQACCYGDDATMATNYPIARLEQGPKVFYCRTARHSTMGVATGTAIVSTILAIPPGTPPGSYQLVVVANGIPSDPVPVKIAAALPALAVDIENGGRFGVVCGTSSLSLELFNVGALDLIVDQVMALPAAGPFRVEPLPAAPVTLAPGAHIDFTLTFMPTTPGPHTGTIRITSNDPNTPTFDLTVSATAGTGVLAVAIADHGDFGRVCVGAFRDEPLTLVNTGACLLTVTDVNSSSPQFLAPDVVHFPLTIAPGTAIHLPIRFEPTVVAPASGVITILSNDPAGAKMIRVSGEVPAGKLVVTGSTCFGAVPARTCSERVIAICNVGECRLNVTGVKFKRNSRHWTLINDPFPAVLHPGSCLNLVIRYKATERCPRSQDLLITSDDPVTPVKELELSATTSWERCGCEKCREDCRAGDRDHQRHGGCRTDCCCDDGDDRRDDDDEKDDR